MTRFRRWLQTKRPGDLLAWRRVNTFVVPEERLVRFAVDEDGEPWPVYERTGRHNVIRSESECVGMFVSNKTDNTFRGQRLVGRNGHLIVGYSSECRNAWPVYYTIPPNTVGLLTIKGPALVKMSPQP